VEKARVLLGKAIQGLYDYQKYAKYKMKKDKTR
jgi:hypothetical protein